MELEHRDILRRNFCTLIANIEMDDALYVQFMITGLFTQSMVETIREAGGRRQRAVEMLMMLTKRGPRAFQLFLDALDKTGQTELADILRL